MRCYSVYQHFSFGRENACAANCRSSLKNLYP